MCSARADTEAYVIDSGILTILGWLVVSPYNNDKSRKSETYTNIANLMVTRSETERARFKQKNVFKTTMNTVNRKGENICFTSDAERRQLRDKKE